MAGPGYVDLQSLDIKGAITGCGKLTVSKVLLDKVLVEQGQGFFGPNELVFVADNAFGLQGPFYKDGQQGSGHAVADYINNIKTQGLLIEPKDVVDVSADPTAGLE